MTEFSPLVCYSGAFAGPGPVVHPQTRPFWDRLAEQRVFSVARCLRCGTRRYPLAPGCHACLSFEYEWVDLDPEGTVSAAVRVERATGISAWQAGTPYTSALVDLADGLRVPGRVLCDCGAALRHGCAVRMCLVPTASGGVVPAFVHACYAGAHGSSDANAGEAP